MKYLRVKNYEKYQHYGQRNPPWIKLYKTLLTDIAFMKLDVMSRYVYVGLLILASETENCIPNDTQWIANRLSVSCKCAANIRESNLNSNKLPASESPVECKCIDLTPLFYSGLLLASRYQLASIEKSRDRDRDRDRDRRPVSPVGFLSDSHEVRLAKLLSDLILARNPKFKEPKVQTWAKSIDLMLRVDKRPVEDVEAIIRWCQADPFWQNNILSTDKLRKQYDQLDLKRRSNPLVSIQTNKLQAGINAFLNRGAHDERAIPEAVSAAGVSAVGPPL